MKRSLLHVGAALATLAPVGTLAACSNSFSSSSSGKPAASSSAAIDSAALAPGEDAGFKKQFLGNEAHVDPLVVGGVYFQPVEMGPQVSTPAAESSIHVEADIAATADNKLGYGVGGFAPGLVMDYAIEDKPGNAVQEDTLMSMSASDSPHYGLNLPKLDVGTYDVSFMIKPPSMWLLHTDRTMGVEGHF